MALFNDATEKRVEPESANRTTQSPKIRDTVPSRQAHRVSPEPSVAYLDATCKIVGKINFEGSAGIDGQVDGEISATESLAIGEAAAVKAQIKTSSLMVGGKLTGDVVADQRIEIRRSGKLSGNLTTPVLVVHEGAVFDGQCTMRSDRSATAGKASSSLQNMDSARTGRSPESQSDD
jgi:cytoskeletal protein CcmA (bactofilin family)